LFNEFGRWKAGVYSVEYALKTSEFAKKVAGDILPQSVHRRYCLTGSYYGVVPKKLPNGRLDWPEDAELKLDASKTEPSSGEGQS
jgi:hypothetical protein